jgi:hypothetical protein
VAGVVPGIHSNAALGGQRYQIGFRFITVSSDWAPMVSGMESDLTTSRQAARPGTAAPA